MSPLITPGNLGAWLIKSDPDSKFDLPRQIKEQGTELVTNRCVANNYRSRMMKPGDRAILWVSGDGRRMTRGIWGVGWVTGFVHDFIPDGGNPAQGGHSRNEADRLPVNKAVALNIPIFRWGTELAAADLVNAGVTGLEVQTQAHMSNPSWVTKAQLAKIEALLAPWPAYREPGTR